MEFHPRYKVQTAEEDSSLAVEITVEDPVLVVVVLGVLEVILLVLTLELLDLDCLLLLFQLHTEHLDPTLADILQVEEEQDLLVLIPLVVLEAVEMVVEPILVLLTPVEVAEDMNMEVTLMAALAVLELL